MAASTAQAWFIAGAAPFLIAGGLHILAAIVDTVRPTFFAPTEGDLIPQLQDSGIRLRGMFPGGSGAKPSLWRAWLGFNISHGLGAVAFGLLCLLIATHDYALFEEIAPMGPITIAISATYFLLSLRFWFYGPAIATGFGTACFVIAALSL